MRRLYLYIIIALATCSAGASCSRPYTFVQMSDPQIGFLDTSARYAGTDSLMRRAMEMVNGIGPMAVFITGDLVNRPSDIRQDSIYRVRKAQIRALVWEVPGNHDVLSDNDVSGATSASFVDRIGAYRDRRGYDRFSFRERGDAFIGIDSNCIKEADGEGEEEQFEWLRAQLSMAAGARHIFVFLHCPIIRERIDEPEDYFNFPVDKRRRYIDLFKDAGVTAVFAGHTHKAYSCSYDGIAFYTAGPVGMPLDGGESGFNVVRVGRDGVSVEFVPTGR